MENPKFTKKQAIIDIETTGLEPLQDRITCISLVFSDKNGTIFSWCSVDEAQNLKEFIDFSQKHEINSWVSFNGDSFDIPFIIKRCLVNNVKVPNFEKNIDLRKIVNGFFYSYNKYEHGTLDNWADILGITRHTQDGETMKKLFKLHKFDEIIKHCEECVEVTKAIYIRCVNCGVIK